MTERHTTWREALTSDAYQTLFSDAFLTSNADLAWTPCRADSRAAAALHIELVSRISTQRLGYSDGVEAGALASLHSLFERAREICHRHLGATHFEALVWHVLNTHVRPFTARWHRRSTAGELRALDQTDLFRAELEDVQARLRTLDALLLLLRSDAAHVVPSPDATASPALEAELAAVSEAGLTAKSGDDPALARTEARNTFEKAAIAERRAYYDIAPDAPAVGLALSGGGIRSATFSLGVLMGLARRGVLGEIDYLSTVSGGGYLGCSLVNFLAGAVPTVAGTAGLTIGLRKDDQPFGDRDRQSRAIGHIRQSSRYLAAGPVIERLELALIQLAGLLINLVTLTALVTLSGLLIRAVAHAIAVAGFAIGACLLGPWAGTSGLPVTGMLMLVALFAAPLIAGRSRRGERIANGMMVSTAALLGAASIDVALQVAGEYWQIANEGTGETLAIVLLIPLGLLIAGILGERLVPKGKPVGRLVAQIAGPVFLLFVFLATAIVNPWVALSVALVALALFGTTLNLNFTSLHRAYRDKLAEAFLVRASDDKPGVVAAADTPLSALADSKKGPYPIINCALNVPASTDPRMRGRLTDFFSFTPHFCGSPLTGYRPTTDWEGANPDMTLATAMAVSGAALAPQMGSMTNAPMRFWMALLNMRLDWWIRQPDRARGLGLCADYLVRELSGRITERTAYLNLSDGGHIENLGVYELLKRRCKYIIAVDGEQDEQMTFQGMANLQRLAAIDLDIGIEIDLDDLRRDPAGLSRSHFQFCRIRYPDGAVGFLLYLKLSITGNEGEFLRRFKLDEPDFPHHPTVDQNFTETRFEAYRSLGEHVADKLFLRSIVGAVATQDSVRIPDWFAAVARSFLV